MIRCAVCHEPLRDDGPLGYVHDTGSAYGEDGHTAMPVRID